MKRLFGTSRHTGPNRPVSIVLKAVAVGMSVTSIVLGVLGVADTSTQVTLLGIGLAALAIAALQNE